MIKQAELADQEPANAPTPTIAYCLGFSGLIPFVAFSAISWLGPVDWHPTANTLLLGYAIAILSFMGGIHWGSAMTRQPDEEAGMLVFPYVVSVVPALAAWLAFMLPTDYQFAWLAFCFALLLAYDLRATKHGAMPSWYPRLRWPLTLVVILCLTLAVGT